MAFISSEITFTGSLGNLSAYRVKGSDKIVVRTKGGATRDRIKKDPNFDLTRRNNAEFTGRVRMSMHIMQEMFLHRRLADYNLSGPLNGVLCQIQKRDETNVLGQRSILLSEHRGYLEGFSLNRKFPFDAVVRTAPKVTLDRATGSAIIELPELIPGVNFFAQTKHPLYRLTVALSAVCDMVWTDMGYKKINERDRIHDNIMHTDWYPARYGSAASTLSLAIGPLPDKGVSMMLTIGICYGTLDDVDTIEPVRRVGSAKVLVLG